MSATDMVCMSCGKRKAYPDGFPNRAFAECWQCAWDGHIRSSHPEIVRRIRREAKKRARRLKERDIADAMFEAERRQVFGPTRPGHEDTSVTAPAETTREESL